MYVGDRCAIAIFEWKQFTLTNIQMIAAEICEAFFRNKEVLSACWLMIISLSASYSFDVALFNKVREKRAIGHISEINMMTQDNPA